jgi:uncharacterized membrane protein
MDYLHHASFGIGVLGVLVIIYGVASGLVHFLQTEFHAARGRSVEEYRKRLRHVLGYYLLLGLEFLIAADIIDTLMKPSVQDLIVLGSIVLIRTVISYSLNTELRTERNGVAVRSRCLPLYERHQEEFELTEESNGALMPLGDARTAQRAVPTRTTP